MKEIVNPLNELTEGERLQVINEGLSFTLDEHGWTLPCGILQVYGRTPRETLHRRNWHFLMAMGYREADIGERETYVARALTK